MKEEWKEIKGFNGLYMISNKGDVVSFRSGSSKILKPHTINSKAGKYLAVALNKLETGGSASTKSVQKLVAEHFLPNPTKKKFASVIDGDYTNVCVTNLKWYSKLELNLQGLEERREKFFKERNV